MILKNYLSHVKLGTKFNLLLLLVFIVGISLSGAVLSSVLQQRAQDEVTAKATIFMETLNSVRDYSQDHIFPILQPKLEGQSTFIPEAIPTFSVREVVDYFRKAPEYKDFRYKDAAPNPTNLQDKADDFEMKLVEQFRKEPGIHEVSGFRTLPQGKVFYIARPFVIPEQQCLQCHSNPAIAPKSLLETYGPEHGFNWHLNEVVAAQIVSVPAEAVFNQAQRSFLLVIELLIGVFAVVILLINFLLKKAVIQRVKRISSVAQAVSMGDMEAKFEESSHDEIGALAIAFKRMRSSLEIAMNLLRQQKK